MTTFHVTLAEPTEDEEVAIRTIAVVADRLDYDENGILELWHGPGEAQRLVAVFSPQAWLRAYDAAKASQLEPRDD